MFVTHFLMMFFDAECLCDLYSFSGTCVINPGVIAVGLFVGTTTVISSFRCVIKGEARWEQFIRLLLQENTQLLVNKCTR